MILRSILLEAQEVEGYCPKGTTIDARAIKNRREIAKSLCQMFELHGSCIPSRYY